MEKKTDMVDFGTDLDKVVFNFRHITTDEDVIVILVLTKYIETSRVEIVLCFLPKKILDLALLARAAQQISTRSE